MDAVKLGPLMLNWSLVSFLLSATVGYYAITVTLRRSGRIPSSVPDLIINGLIFGVLAWKLSPFFVQPSLLWKAPIKTFMMTGSDYGIVLGCIIAGIYVLVRAFLSRLSVRLLIDLLAYGSSVFILFRGLLNGWQYGKPTTLPWGISLEDPSFAYHPINIYEILLGVGLIVLFWLGRMRPDEGKAGQALLLFGGLGTFGITLLETGGSIGYLFTGNQWLGLLAMAVGLMLPQLYILWETQLERRIPPDDGIQRFESAEGAGEGKQAGRKDGGS